MFYSVCTLSVFLSLYIYILCIHIYVYMLPQLRNTARMRVAFPRTVVVRRCPRGGVALFRLHVWRIELSKLLRTPGGLCYAATGAKHDSYAGEQSPCWFTVPRLQLLLGELRHTTRKLQLDRYRRTQVTMIGRTQIPETEAEVRMDQ